MKALVTFKDDPLMPQSLGEWFVFAIVLVSIMSSIGAVMALPWLLR
jgi:hypothetical protein